MPKRPSAEINAGSMSDISFLLLTFFLLTSSVDVNKGMPRRLPPMVDNPEKQDVDVKINERNLLLIKVNMRDNLSVNRTPSDISILKERVRIFLTNPNNDPSLPEKEIKEIEGVGAQEVSKGIVSLVTDRGTGYRMYMAVQNEIMKAYNELRDEFAMEKFGKKFDELTEDKQEAVKKKYPLNISEAEPTDVKKTK